MSLDDKIRHKRDSEDKILRVFQALDVDKKGYLEAHELQTLMTTYGEKFRAEEVGSEPFLSSFRRNNCLSS